MQAVSVRPLDQDIVTHTTLNSRAQMCGGFWDPSSSNEFTVLPKSSACSLHIGNRKRVPYAGHQPKLERAESSRRNRCNRKRRQIQKVTETWREERGREAGNVQTGSRHELMEGKAVISSKTKNANHNCCVAQLWIDLYGQGLVNTSCWLTPKVWSECVGGIERSVRSKRKAAYVRNQSPHVSF